MSARAIERLIEYFGPPAVDNPQAVYVELHRALHGSHEEKIMRTIDIGIKSRWKFFPKVSEITELMRELHPFVEPKPKQWPEPPKRSAEEVAHVRAMAKDCIEFLSNAAFTPTTPYMDETQRQHFIAAQRPGFEKMMRESRNRHLYLKPIQPSQRGKMAAAGGEE